MFSFFKNILTKEKDENFNNNIDEHQLESTKLTAAAISTETENNAESTADNDDKADLRKGPYIVLTNCSNVTHLRKNKNKSNAKLSDGGRTQRRCAKVARKRISKIAWESDKRDPKFVDCPRSQSKRLCAEVAKTRITKIVDVSSSESDEDYSDKSEME